VCRINLLVYLSMFINIVMLYFLSVTINCSLTGYLLNWLKKVGKINLQLINNDV